MLKNEKESLHSVTFDNSDSELTRKAQEKVKLDSIELLKKSQHFVLVTSIKVLNNNEKEGFNTSTTSNINGEIVPVFVQAINKWLDVIMREYLKRTFEKITDTLVNKGKEK